MSENFNDESVGVVGTLPSWEVLNNSNPIHIAETIRSYLNEAVARGESEATARRTICINWNRGNAWISSRLKLLDLPNEVQEEVRQFRLKASRALSEHSVPQKPKSPSRKKISKSDKTDQETRVSRVLEIEEMQFADAPVERFMEAYEPIGGPIMIHWPKNTDMHGEFVWQVDPGQIGHRVYQSLADLLNIETCESEKRRLVAYERNGVFYPMSIPEEHLIHMSPGKENLLTSIGPDFPERFAPTLERFRNTYKPSGLCYRLREGIHPDHQHWHLHRQEVRRITPKTVGRELYRRLTSLLEPQSDEVMIAIGSSDGWEPLVTQIDNLKPFEDEKPESA